MQECEYESVFAEYFPFWNDLSEDNRSLLCKSTHDVRYKKGQNVHGGSECTGAVIVKQGCLRAYLLSEEGREVTLYRLFPGDICTLSASCVLKSITFDVFVDSEEDSDCFLINGGAFMTACENDLRMKNFALEMAVRRFSDVMWIMQQILFMSFDKRLAIFLLDETEKSGSDTVKLTHEQIAKYIGSAREVVSRMLKYFSSEGIVAVSRGGIQIADKRKLQKLAC